MNQPPRRAPMQIAGETEDAASLLARVLTAAESASGWLVDDAVFATRTLDDGPTSAIIEARSEGVSGHIECELHPSGWLCAEVFAAETMLMRVWAEHAADGVGFWPDGADADGACPGLLTGDGIAIDCPAWPELERADALTIPRIGAEE